MKKKGFTLIELIVCLAIVSILVLAVGSVLSINLNILNSSYSAEKEYKQANTAILYVSDKIRKAQKIEEIAGEENLNFILYVDGYKLSSGRSKIRFSLEDRITEDKGYKVLYAYIDSEKTRENREGKVRIAILKDIYIHYDKAKQTMDILINKSSEKSRIKTYIKLEDRL